MNSGGRGSIAALSNSRVTRPGSLNGSEPESASRAPKPGQRHSQPPRGRGLTGVTTGLRCLCLICRPRTRGGCLLRRVGQACRYRGLANIRARIVHRQPTATRNSPRAWPCCLPLWRHPHRVEHRRLVAGRRPQPVPLLPPRDFLSHRGVVLGAAVGEQVARR